MGGLFNKVEGAVVVLRSKGVYRQVDVYRRDHNGDLYAKACGGFIGLRHGMSTTKPDVSWEVVEGVEYTSRATGPLTVVDEFKKVKAA